MRASIVNAGLDPDQLDAGNIETMKFGSDGSSKSKAWRDIWGSGQGIGVIDRVFDLAGQCGGFTALKRLVDRCAELERR